MSVKPKEQIERALKKIAMEYSAEKNKNRDNTETASCKSSSNAPYQHYGG